MSEPTGAERDGPGAGDRSRPVRVDPQRRRMMAELAAWHTEWAAKWGIDDHPYEGLDIDQWEARIPPEAEADYRRRADEIMGIDPATGRRADPADPAALTGPAAERRPRDAAADRPPLARTPDEALLFMDVHPCPRCGAHRTPWESGALVEAGGELARRYTGECANCGEHREFVFRLPEHVPSRPDGAEVHYGGAEPSELFDPGQWLAMADSVAEVAFADRARGDTALARPRAELAAACVAEALKFVPAGARAVPDPAFRTAAGRAAHDRDPERFTRRRLETLLGTLREEFALPGAEQEAAEQGVRPAGPPLARTSAELHLFLDLQPCVCGTVRAEWASRVRDLDDGLVAEYTAPCPQCGRDRLFTFLLPEEPVESGPEGAGFRYGGDRPSELIDPGEWLATADRLARSVPMLPAGAGPAERDRFRFALGRAAAALAEVMRFAPPGAAAVPESACFTERGREVYRAEPGRFRLDRLAVVRESYLQLLGLTGH